LSGQMPMWLNRLKLLKTKENNHVLFRSNQGAEIQSQQGNR
jgi:hypothetical protein